MTAITGVDSAAQTLPANPETLKVDAYPWFDWLRFVLASVVVLDHTGFKFLPFLGSGIAVKVFFALSGWLIGGILLRTRLDELPRFFFNRATRIWIPYAAAIVLLYGVAAAREGIDVFWFKYLLLDVTFTHQLYTFFPAAFFELPLGGSGNQFWSIAVEEQFYLVAPLIILLLPRGKSILLWVPITVLTVALNWHAASISLGVCAAILQRNHAIATRSWVRLAALALALICAVAIARTHETYVVGPLFAVAVVVLLAMPGRRSGIALIAGGLSYPLYLNQWIASFAVNFLEARWLPLDRPAYVVTVYVLSVLSALVLYWLIDRQVMLRRNSWYSATLGRRLGAIAYLLVGAGIVLGGLFHLYGPHAEVPPGFQQPSEHRS